MLKSGLYVSKSGVSYTVYEVEEKGYERIDFMKHGADFQVDYDQVVFSRLKRRKTYVYGDRNLYSEYKDFIYKTSSINCSIDKETYWDNNKFYEKNRKEQPKFNFLQESIMCNGLLESSTTILGNITYTTTVIDQVFDVKINPMNFDEYEELELSKSVPIDVNTPYYPLSMLRQKYDIAHIDKNDYVVADNLIVATQRLEEFDKVDVQLRGVDTETTGIDVDMYGEDKLVGVILSWSETQSTYYPFRHKKFQNLPMSFLETIIQVLNKHRDSLVAHNKKFDRKVFLKEGYDVRIRHDTMQLSIVLNPVIEKGVHALKTLMWDLTHRKYLELADIFVSAKLIDFSVLPKDIVRVYACPDASDVITVFKKLRPQLPQAQEFIYNLECSLADLKADQEYYGERVNVKKYMENYKNCNYVLDTLLRAFREMTHISGNVNSPEVLRDLIYNKLRCKVLVRTKTGKASTSGQAIKKIAGIKAEKEHNITEPIKDLHGNVVIKAEELAQSKYPVLLILDKYREYNKRKTAFYSRFERTMKTGRVFFWVNQNGAASGRQSSPMHQLPPELKDVMLADTPDHSYVGPDYSQIELRMIAWVSGEQKLIDLCNDPDNDIHRVIGSLISGKEQWEITSKMRSEGKKRNFGVIYLISEYGLAGQYFGPGYTKAQVKWCRQMLDDFYHTFPRITRFIARNAAFVKKHGFMKTKFNRVRPFKEILDPDITSKRQASLVRQANNMPVQGTAADLMKISECNYDTYIREKGWNKIVDGFPLVRVMLSIHDEAAISAHKSIPKEEIIKMIRDCMEINIKGAPKFFVQPAFMDSWGGHTDDSLAMPIRLRDKIIEDYVKDGTKVFKQSLYKIVIPENINELLNENSNVKEKDLPKVLLNDFKYEYVSGDMGDTMSIKQKMSAIAHYLETGDTKFYCDNYREVLADYRESTLVDYMAELISKYGLDYKAVGEHVRHPSLTHELLNRYWDDIKDLELEHVDQITEAVRLYIEDLEKNHTEALADLTIEYKEKETSSEFFNQAESLVNFDSNGELVSYEEEEEEDEFIYDDYDDEEYINEATNPKVVRAWELADVILADVEGLNNNDDVQKVIDYMWQFRDDNGFYHAKLRYGGALVDTQFRIEEIDIDALNDFIIDLEQQTHKLEV